MLLYRSYCSAAYEITIFMILTTLYAHVHRKTDGQFYHWLFRKNGIKAGSCSIQ